MTRVSMEGEALGSMNESYTPAKGRRKASSKRDDERTASGLVMDER